METPTDKNADTQINELKKRLKPTIERLWAASGKEPKFLKIMQTYFWDMDKLHLTGPIGISELEKAFPSFSLFSLGHTAQTAIQDFTNLKKGINDIIVADRAQVRNELNSLSEGNTPDSWKAYQNASVKIKINKYASGWINTPSLPGQMFKSQEELVKAVKVAWPWSKPDEENLEKMQEESDTQRAADQAKRQKLKEIEDRKRASEKEQIEKSKPAKQPQKQWYDMNAYEKDKNWKDRQGLGKLRPGQEK